MKQGITDDCIFQARKIWRSLHNVPLNIIACVRGGVTPRVIRNLKNEQADMLNAKLQALCADVDNDNMYTTE
jgi:hypothetical protein